MHRRLLRRTFGSKAHAHVAAHERKSLVKKCSLWYAKGSMDLQSHWSRTSTRRWRVLAAVTFVVGNFGAACSSESEAPAMAGAHGTGGARADGGTNTGGFTLGGTGSTNDDVATGACTMGDSRSCRYVISSYQNQESCFVGMQYCDTDTWTKCIDPRDAS